MTKAKRLACGFIILAQNFTCTEEKDMFGNNFQLRWEAVKN